MPIIFGIVALAIGYFLLRQHSTDSTSVTSSPTTGTGVGSTNLPTQTIGPNSSRPRPVVTVNRRQPRDLKPQFTDSRLYRWAVQHNPDPRHLIPHMAVQEGHAIKYEDIRGGSDTINIVTGK